MNDNIEFTQAEEGTVIAFPKIPTRITKGMYQSAMHALGLDPDHVQKLSIQNGKVIADLIGLKDASGSLLKTGEPDDFYLPTISVFYPLVHDDEEES